MKYAWFLWPLSACLPDTADRQWSESRVMTPHLTTLDRNQDGTVDASEYERVRWNGPPFATADRDRSGGLDAAELARLVRGQSATRFDGRGHSETKPAVGLQPPRDRAVQHVVETLIWTHHAREATGKPALSSTLRSAVEDAQSLDDPSLMEAHAILDLPVPEPGQ